MHPAYRTSGLYPVSGLGAGGAAEVLTQTLTAFGQSTVKGARFRSAVSPEVRLDGATLFAGQSRPAAGEGGPGTETLLRFIRPAVYIDTTLGTRVIAPWGEPQRNWFPLLAVAGVVLTAVGVGVLVRGLRR